MFRLFASLAFPRARLAARARQVARGRHDIIEHPDEKLRRQNINLDAALNNITQGLCMFDANEQIVVVNRRFLEMYKLSPQVVKPGCTVPRAAPAPQGRRPDGGRAGRVLRHRSLPASGRTRPNSGGPRPTEGRLIQAFTQPLPGGGWVTTHEDVTEQRRAEEQIARAEAAAGHRARQHEPRAS